MNERTLNRSKNFKKRLQFADIDLNENDLCDMKNKQLQKKTFLTFMKIMKSTKTTKSSKLTKTAKLM